MNLYAESSAVLAWLLKEEAAARIEECFDRTSGVVASDLTLLECERTLIRARTLGLLSEIEMMRRRAIFEAATTNWVVLKLEREILERARRRFPAEPLRTLDAVHVASALVARAAIPDLVLLSLDQRVRDNAAALGFDLLPE